MIGDASLRLLYIGFCRIVEWLALLPGAARAWRWSYCLAPRERGPSSGQHETKTGLGRSVRARHADPPVTAGVTAASAGHPVTVLAWHRRLVARHGTYPNRSGRPWLDPAVVALIEEMARANPGWGYVRIRGELLALGYRVGTSTIRRILTRSGIPPAPTRRDHPTWRRFLRAQASTTLACDLFTVDCAVSLRRFYVIFVMAVASRYVHIVGATSNPDGAWTTQQIRNLLMDLGERADQFGYMIRDRAGRFTTAFDAVLTDAGVRVVKIPPQCPRANAYAERFVRTARAEVTDRRLLIFGERHFSRVLTEYGRHYNGWRPHRALLLQPPRSSRPVVDLTKERIKRRPVLGGLVNEYQRAA